MASFADTGNSDDDSFFDPSRPFAGVVVCCTSIPPELRADIAKIADELGGCHKYDLTPDCTHLIVGDYDTPKYRHVAKERPDVKVMAAQWIMAVRDIWVQDAEIDFRALEKEWQLKTFETGTADRSPNDPPGAIPERTRLLCCLTGFEDYNVRQEVSEKIRAHGGDYTGDLTKKVTHLIAYKPSGAKYQAAKNWGVHTVSIEWVNDSIERGLILEEKCYDPIIPPEQRGAGAWNRESVELRFQLGKRMREAAEANKDEGRRKLRKTASMKLLSQQNTLWGDILGKPKLDEAVPMAPPQPTVPAPSASRQPTQQQSGPMSMDTQGSRLSSFGAHDESVIFASCCFYIHGFEKKKYDILANVIGSLGGLVCHSLEEVVSTSGAQLSHRFLIVPQNSASDSHPPLPENVIIITEFYIERCMHNKYFFDPREHVIGRPFPNFPIPGFEKLSISTAGFTGIDLNQVEKSVRQLGAIYQEKFTAQASVLVCISLQNVRPQKLDMAVAWRVPVVSAEWLWQCISTGYNVPIEEHICSGFRERVEAAKRRALREQEKGDLGKRSRTTQDQIDPDLAPKAQTKQPKKRGFDVSGLVEAFKTSSSKAPESSRAKLAPKEKRGNRSALELQQQGEDSFANAHFETAPTHQLQINTESNGGNSSASSRNMASAPLSEASNSSLNKTPRSPNKQGDGKGMEENALPSQAQQQQQRQPRKPMVRVFSEVADSEATEGDVGSADELPPLGSVMEREDPGPEQQQRQEESPEEIERKRIEAQKEEERLALASKFAFMIGSGTSAAVAGPDSLTEDLAATADAAGRSGGGLARVLSESGISVSGSGGVTTTTMTMATTTTTTATRRRKREIMGRAISNVSAASSGSAESVAVTSITMGVTAATATESGGDTAAAVALGSGLREDPISTTSVSDNSASGGDEVHEDDGKKSAAAQVPEGAGAPPATQLEYRDLEATKNRAKMMRKIRVAAGSETGSVGSGSAAGSSRRARGGSFTEDTEDTRPEGKLSLADLVACDLPNAAQQEKQLAAYGSGASTRRVTRRRGL
ncbi:S-M checkpoint control protein rad4 [Rhypophila sp. PSN 637]